MHVLLLLLLLDGCNTAGVGPCGLVVVKMCNRCKMDLTSLPLFHAVELCHSCNGQNGWDGVV